MTPGLHTEMLNDRIKAIADAITRLRQGERRHAEARSVRGSLMDILDLIERNPGVDAAVDDLHRGVCALVDDLHRGVCALVEAEPSEGGLEARRVRLVCEAYARLLDRLRAAGAELADKGANG